MRFTMRGILAGALASIIISTPAMAESPLGELEAIGSELTQLSAEDLVAPVEARCAYAKTIKTRLDEVLQKADYSNVDKLSAAEQERFSYLVTIVSKRLAVLEMSNPEAKFSAS